jgi:hypothetical protein
LGGARTDRFTTTQETNKRPQAATPPKRAVFLQRGLRRGKREIMVVKF